MHEALRLPVLDLPFETWIDVINALIAEMQKDIVHVSEYVNSAETD